MNTSKSIRVSLVDDHTMVRAGFRALLKEFDDIECVAEASDGREAVEVAGSELPDVMLMDIAMPPGMNGLEATQRINKEFPAVRVIILSMYPDEEYVSRALRVGASGYLLKDGATAELSFAIRAVARGETYLTPKVSKPVVRSYLQGVSGESGSLELLTPRQKQVLECIAESKTTKMIACDLDISVKTVESHRHQLYERLGIHDVAGLVKYAMRMKMVSSSS